MTRDRTSTAWFLLWVGLLYLSFRPVPEVERALDVACVPLRYLAELASPLQLLRARAASAAEKSLARSALAEAAEGSAAIAELAARALPGDPVLREGRRFVHGEISERPDKDHAWVVVGDGRGIERETPVVCGDVFVGRATEVRPQAPAPRALVLVELVTASGFRVGATVHAEEPFYLTVGGLQVRRAPRGSQREVRLAVHQPSSSALDGGIARVQELFAEGGELAETCVGFRLGTVHREAQRGPWWIEPELDYLDGLFQVAFVTRADPSLPEARAVEPALGDRSWLATRALGVGDPNPWRRTLKVPVGRTAGVREGDAVTGAGARLIGRVIRASEASSDVALLQDPGFSLAAVACLAGDPEPRTLGRLTSLGAGAEGEVRMRWSVRTPLDAGPGDASEVSARIFSGSGDPGLPAGLFLGTALLPRTAAAGEEREIRLRFEVEPADVRRLFVRRSPDPTRAAP